MGSEKLDLGWLRIFFEVGRTGNLTAAADRLGLSQPAVSYQIRRIEQQLEISLFERQHRGVKLNAEGSRLFDIASRTVEEIDSFARRVKRGPFRPTIRLKTDYAFSSLWLMPRMNTLRQLYPQMDIEIVAAHRDGHPLPEEGELSVVFGTREEFGKIGQFLSPERVAPVCAPNFLKLYGPLDTPPEIAATRRLHLDTQGPSPWHDWESYFKMLGQLEEREAERSHLRFNTYSLVVQAALAEQGVALGWLDLLDTLLENGLLVSTGPQLVSSERGYWILPPSETMEGAELLVDWLMDAFTVSRGG